MTVSPADLPNLNPDALQAHILELCAHGPRFVGSPAEVRAREYITRQFEAAGLSEVRLEELTVLGYEPERASCQLIGEDVTLPAVGLQSTASATTEGEAIYVGSPESIADLERFVNRGISLAGKVVILHSYYPFAFGNWLNAHGVAGIVVIVDTPDRVIGHFTAQLYPPAFEDRPLPIPGVTIEATAANNLLALMTTRTQRLRVEHRASYPRVQTANIIGQLPGTTQADEYAVIGAHYDSQLEGVGACDNASGTAALIEIARTWKSMRLRRTVVFVAFADEEGGIWGSTDYCRRHVDTLARTVGMICLDALAWLYPCKRRLHSDPSIREFALASAEAVGWNVEEELEASILETSDLNPFIDAGVPACMFWRYPPQHPHYHSLGDTPDLLSYRAIAETATAAAFTLLRLAQEPTLGLGRSRPTKRWVDLRPEGSVTATTV
jgi:aminopeptidase YwaD